MPVETPRPAKTPHDLALGTTFPARLLNALPGGWRRRHLIRASGGETEPEGSALTERFRSARKVLLAWPSDPVSILLAFPAARSLVDVLPAGTECLHLCEASCASLVQGLFPNAVLVWDAPRLAWHDAATKVLTRNLRGFAPDITVAFSVAHYPTVLQAALRASGARVRIGWDGATNAPFVNASLSAEGATPLAARFFRCLDLWRYAGFAPRTQWTWLRPDTGRHEEAVREWETRRADPGSTWLFVQDAADIDALDADLFEELRARIAAREPGRFTLGAVLWNPSRKPVERRGGWMDAPVFNEADFSALLAALDGTRGVIGFHGFALHFASLVEVRCVALLKPSEGVYDATGLNPLFEAERL